MSKAISTDIEKDILLAHFTIENLHEAVYWIDEAGYIFMVNQKACELSGYSKEELMGMHVKIISPLITEKYWEENWAILKKEKKLVFERQHKNKDGHLYPIVSSNHFIEYNGNEYLCSVISDVRKKKLEEELLRIVSEGTMGKVGIDFYEALAKYISNALDVDR